MIASLWLFGLLTMLTGCPHQQIIETPTDVTYEQVRERHNQRIEQLDRLWAAAVVAMEWREDGKRRFEQGEGHLVWVAPGQIMLTAGKLGETYIHLGSDGERYWLFDQQGDRTAHVGSYANVGKACADSLGLPVTPDTLPELMGLTPLPPPSPGNDIRIEGPAREGGLALLVPGAEPGLQRRILIDPLRGEPYQMQIIDQTGERRLTVHLSNYESVETDGIAAGAWPRVAGRVVFELPNHEGELRLTLSRMTDARRTNRIRDQAFDFDYLSRRVYRPGRTVDLDAGCE